MTILVVPCDSDTRLIRTNHSLLSLTLPLIILYNLTINMDAAIARKHENPQEPILQVAASSHVASSTFHDRLTGKHGPRGEKGSRVLSVEQERVLLDKINDYAERGTLLSPAHITQLATALAGHTLGKNWTGTFLLRHKDSVNSKFYRVQEVSRLNADTPENRQAFYSLVCLIQLVLSRTDEATGHRCCGHRVICFLQHLQHGRMRF